MGVFLLGLFGMAIYYRVFSMKYTLWIVGYSKIHRVHLLNQLLYNICCLKNCNQGIFIKI